MGGALRRSPINREIANPIPVLKRKELSESGGAHSGNLLNSFFKLAITRPVHAGGDVQCENILCCHSRWDALQLEESTQQETRAD